VLDKLAQLKTDSHHVFLQEAWHLAPPVLFGREWSEIEKAMTERKFAVVESWDNGDYIHRTYLIKKNAFSFPGGGSLDVCLTMSAPNAGKPTRPFRPGKVSEANVTLIANIGKSYAKTIEGQRFPKGSVIDAVLRSADVKEAGEVWPLVKQVSVHYAYVENRWSEFNPSGFHVTVEFAASATEDLAGNKLYFTVASGLDPLRTDDGEEDPPAGFRPKDTLGDVRGAGGNEWWRGDSATVEANKKKYLLKMP